MKASNVESYGFFQIEHQVHVMNSLSAGAFISKLSIQEIINSLSPCFSRCIRHLLVLTTCFKSIFLSTMCTKESFA